MKAEKMQDVLHSVCDNVVPEADVGGLFLFILIIYLNQFWIIEILTHAGYIMKQAMVTDTNIFDLLCDTTINTHLFKKNPE